MKEAMRARQAGRVRLETIRMMRSALKNAEIEAGGRLPEDQVFQVLGRELKLRREAVEEYRRAGRGEQVERLEEEIEVVRSYLPEPLDEEELRRLARAAIAETGAREPREMGRVMGALMPRVRGRAEGGDVSRVVREELSRQA